VAEELLEERVKKLERALESLAEVPGQLTRLGDHVGGLEGRVTKVESQISQLRSDIQVGFSAAGRDLGDTRDAILEVIDSSSQATRNCTTMAARRCGSCSRKPTRRCACCTRISSSASSYLGAGSWPG
jgi:hypothetical protein